MYQNKIGKGAQVLDAEKLYTQGNLKLTGVSYDMALAGDGFFAVSNTRGGGTSATYFTRAGNFRQGDSGTLQDTVGNEVQGWAMGTEPIVDSSNPNISIFTNDYTKLLSSKIINYSNAVETITAKATDFTLTAQSDDSAIFSGAGLKTKYGKIADVEELIKSYTKALQNLKDDPNSSSATATRQIAHIDLPGGTLATANQFHDTNVTWDTGVVSKDGDEVYVYIDGNKISQSYITGTGTDANGDGDYSDVGDVDPNIDGYRKTMKAFADKISEVPGLKAYVATAGTPYTPSTDTDDVINGTLRIESLIPGEPFTISSTGMVSAGSDKPGTHAVDTESDPGKGLGALESARDALKKAITGKQTDVYTPSDLGLLGAGNTFTYSISIYDNGQEKNIYIPSSGDPSNPANQEVITLADPADIDALVAAINNTGTATTGGATNNLPTYVKAYNINGNLVVKSLDSNFDVEFTSDLKRTVTSNAGTSPLGDVKRNADFSGREGAGAEFLEIKTRIDQTASKGSLQLRLDTLSISDSAFGDFAVDETGLITMSQDGAMFAVGQVAIAKFITNRGLDPIGNNLFESTLASGDPIYNLNNDKTAEVKANTLELSTADLSESLVNLMVFQRAFEANAKSITTADTVLNTLIQLKR
jgi:flagellar hook protein FlgE